MIHLGMEKGLRKGKGEKASFEGEKPACSTNVRKNRTMSSQEYV